MVVFLVTVLALKPYRLSAQAYETKSVLYNTFIGGFCGSVGSLINKKKGEKWYKAVLKGFLVGTGGGATMYAGKKMNYLINKKHELGYAWLSRAVFDAGNSVVENASANRDFWSVWHYDLGFIRFEFHAKEMSLQPKLMPSVFAGTVFAATQGKFDLNTTIKSGIPTFRTKEVSYAPQFTASTVTNGIVFSDSLRTGSLFFEIYAHEVIHTFQFQEFSGANYFLKPVTDHWKDKYPWFKKMSKWVYGDLNYEIMGINYFLIQKSHYPNDYCHNFLENEAETLSTGRPACPEDH
jgi:hypothetical protein